ncbi:hypothetical protein E2C01_028899 [Portunus trituberculatus]|uniref:Uncharacterized protein n=1 Tax=Portunus trituberculatus TaxID=210409 RepID=A0A5B7EPZ9_PORTR|nr:hypothetical protein [Portunus trituberculatus]
MANPHPCSIKFCHPITDTPLHRPASPTHTISWRGCQSVKGKTTLLFMPDDSPVRDVCTVIFLLHLGMQQVMKGEI